MRRALRAEVSDRLLGRLRDEHAEPRLDYARPPVPLAGGAFSSVFSFRLAGAPRAWSGRLVLRLVESPSVDVRLEAAVQEGARCAGLPAPAVLMVEPSATALGAPFVVMELLPGRAFLGGIDALRFARDFPGIVRSWPDAFAGVVEMLLRTDTAPVLDALAKRGVPMQSARTTRHLDRAERVLADVRALGGAIGWLREHEPASLRSPALVHGDLWPGNVLRRGNEVSGLVDWARCGIGDPALDLGFAKVGFALMPEPFPPPAPVRQLLRVAGRRIAARLAQRCETRLGGAERVRYFEALRCAVELADVVSERRAGRHPGWTHGVPALVEHLESITGCKVPFT